MRAASVLLVLFFALPAAAGVDDYLIVFSSDSSPYSPTKGHTFAAVVRVETAPGRPPCVVDLTSLSWLPATMKVKAVARPETGRNVPLDETFRYCLDPGGSVCMWGPYRVQPELAETFRARVATVESSFQYRGACFLSPLNVCDCVRSVEEMILPKRRYIGTFGYGAASGSFVVRKFSPWLIEPEQCHHWVATLIGLDEWPITRRPYGDYASKWDQWKAMFRRK